MQPRQALPRSIKWAALAIAAILLSASGAAIGGSGRARPQARAQTAPPAPPRSRQGAIAIAADWLDAVDTREKLLDRPRLTLAITRLVLPSARSTMTRRLAAAGSQLRGAPGSPAPVVRSAPLGYRVLSFSSDRAVVATWEVVARSAEGLPPSVEWARSQLTLVWQRGWKIGESRVRIDQAAGITAADMAGMDHDFATFHHAP